ncbi:MAG: hypothetical protein FWD14_06385 [Treponema sp.]|nr:hypothetical protein [Treponema sp.]
MITVAQEKITESYEKYGRIMMDTTIPDNERRLSYLIEQNPQIYKEDREKELLAVQSYFKKIVIFHTRVWADCQFLALKKLNALIIDGLPMMASYCRNLLDIPATQQLTDFDIHRMNHYMKELDRNNDNKSGEDYLFLLKDYSFELAGREFSVQNLSDINEFFSFLESDLFLFATHDDQCFVRFIFCSAEIKLMNDFYEYWIGKEYVRTPQWILGIISEVHGGNGSILRDEACEVIYMNKWKNRSTKAEKRQALRHPYSAICEGLIEKALSCFYSKYSDHKRTSSQAFIKLMMQEPILCHERGHIKSFSDMNPIHRAFRAIFAEGEGAGGVLLEALADFAPNGFFSYVFETAVNNKNLALALVYGFVSDNWFVSPENVNCKRLLSFVQSSLALFFLSSNNEFRFNIIRMQKEREKIYRKLLLEYESLVQNLIDIFMQARFSIRCADGIVESGFEELSQEAAFWLYNECSNQNLLEFSPFWINMQGYLRQWSVEGWMLYEAALKKAETSVEKIILDLINSEITKEDKNERKYNE